MIDSEATAQTGPPVRHTSRPAASYQEYVIGYVKEQRRNVMLAFSGIAVCTGAIVYTAGAPMIVLVAFGLGMAAAGLAGVGLAADAHAKYTAHLAIAHTTTYSTPAPAGPGVRAFVPSTNGAQTIRAGKFRLDRAQWIKLFQTTPEGGRLTRDGAMKALPRPLYRDWAGTLAELARLGIVDHEGIITPEGWQWYHDAISPYPADNMAPPPAYSAHARRTHGRTNGDGAGVTP